MNCLIPKLGASQLLDCIGKEPMNLVNIMENVSIFFTIFYKSFFGRKKYFDEFFFYFLGTLEGIKKFVETDGEYGKAAPDHDEL